MGASWLKRCLPGGRLEEAESPAFVEHKENALLLGLAGGGKVTSVWGQGMHVGLRLPSCIAYGRGWARASLRRAGTRVLPACHTGYETAFIVMTFNKPFSSQADLRSDESVPLVLLDRRLYFALVFSLEDDLDRMNDCLRV